MFGLFGSDDPRRDAEAATLGALLHFSPDRHPNAIATSPSSHANWQPWPRDLHDNLLTLTFLFSAVAVIAGAIRILLTWATTLVSSHWGTNWG